MPGSPPHSNDSLSSYRTQVNSLQEKAYHVNSKRAGISIRALERVVAYPAS